MRAGWLLGLSVALVAFAVAPAAEAQETRAPVLVPPAAEGQPALAVRLDGGSLCVEAGEPDFIGDVQEGGGGCLDVTLTDLADPWLHEYGEQPDIAGAVAAEATSVRYDLAGGTSVLVAAQPVAELRGTLAARLRFYAVRLPLGARVLRVVQLGPDGAELGEWLGDGVAQPFGRMLGRGEHTVRASRWALEPTGRLNVQISAIAEPRPLPGRPMHRVVSTCVRPQVGGRAGRRVCVRQDSEDLRFALADGCTGRRTRVISGIVPATAGKARIVLGDGSVRDAQWRALTATGAPHLAAFAVALPAGSVVRALQFAQATNVSSRRESVGLGPLPRGCDSRFGVEFAQEGVPLEAPRDPAAIAVAGGGALHLAETADRLCISLTGPPQPAACEHPPDRLQAFMYAKDLDTVALVVDRRVASVLLRLRDGTTTTVPAMEAPLGAGPLARGVRYAVHTSRPGRAPTSYDLLTSDGRRLKGSELDAAFSVRRGPTLLTLGAWRVRADVYRWQGSAEMFACGIVVRGPAPVPPPAPAGDDGCDALGAEPGWVSVQARCDMRRVVLMGALSKAGRFVRIRLVGARPMRVAARTLPGGLRVWVVAPPAAAAVQEIAEVGAAERVIGRASISLPPARSQCGYDDWTALEAPDSQSAKTAAAVSPPLVPMNDSVMITR